MSLYFKLQTDNAVHCTDPPSDNGTETRHLEDSFRVEIFYPRKSFQSIRMDQGLTHDMFFSNPLIDVPREVIVVVYSTTGDGASLRISYQSVS